MTTTVLLSTAAPGVGAATAADGPRSTFTMGVTHTQRSADAWNDPLAVGRARNLLSERPVFQNQHLMGWGALNPQPAPGVYDWASLDQRIDLIRRTGGTPVITLCCSPDWMKGGPAGTTDWSRLEEAPRPEHYDDFAALAADTAARYPDVDHFQVWNELKGFYDPVRNTWDIESYTRLYNLVYDAVRAVNPDAQLGGPYVVIDSWANRAAMSHPSPVTGAWGTVDQRSLDAISYWLEHKRGAGFLAIDFATFTRDAGHTVDAFTSNQKILAVMDWIRQRTDLPVWVSEFYTDTDDHQPDPDLGRQAALLTSAASHMARAGVAVAFQWGPQADGTTCIGGCLWSDTRSSTGGQPTPSHAPLGALAGAFPPGTALVRNRTDPRDVTELSSATYTLLTNHHPRATTVTIGDTTVTLRAYESRLMFRPK